MQASAAEQRHSKRMMENLSRTNVRNFVTRMDRKDRIVVLMSHTALRRVAEARGRHRRLLSVLGVTVLTWQQHLGLLLLPLISTIITGLQKE